MTVYDLEEGELLYDNIWLVIWEHNAWSDFWGHNICCNLISRFGGIFYMTIYDLEEKDMWLRSEKPIL